jgi:hypothetical protein
VGSSPERYRAMASSLVMTRKKVSKVFNQRVKEYGFNRSRRLMVDIPFASALGETHGNPVGRLIAGARKSLGIHKGLQQDNGMVINSLPLLGQDSGHSPQKVRGQMRNFHPRKDEETSILGEEMDVSIALSRLPSDELIPSGHLPGRRAPAETGQRAALMEDQVFKVFSHGLAVTQVVVGVDESLVEGFPVGPSHHLEIEGTQLLQSTPKGLAGMEGELDRPPSVPSARVLSGRELNQPDLLQTQEEFAAGHGFKLAVSLSPIPETTEFFGDESAASPLMFLNNRSDEGKIIVVDFSAPDEQRCLHGPGIA